MKSPLTATGAGRNAGGDGGTGGAVGETEGEGAGLPEGAESPEDGGDGSPAAGSAAVPNENAVASAHTAISDARRTVPLRGAGPPRCETAAPNPARAWRQRRCEAIPILCV